MAATTNSTRPIEVRSSEIQGRGVFATRTIRRGDRIVRYTGEHISSDEADRRYPFSEKERHHTFLFTLDDDVIVDAGGRRGNAAKYINHSCDPNCEAVIEDDEIWIYALRTIRSGQELVYDYNFVLDEPHTPANKRLYPCYCGAGDCRGTILAPKRRRASAAAPPAEPRKASKSKSKTKSSKRTTSAKRAKTSSAAGAAKSSRSKSAARKGSSRTSGARKSGGRKAAGRR
jgi:uncharacterized protein